MTNYISHTDSDIREMLEVIGINNISDLFYDIPKGYEKKIDYFSSKSEIDLKKIFYDYANKNVSLNNYISFLGGGAYQHFIPSIINHIAGRSEFYTAYTPYQPEISQGILKVIFEYQTMISNLFGLEIANASLYDGATALAEAVLMACSYTGKNKAAIDAGINPNYIKVLKTYLWAKGIELTDLSGRSFDETNVGINRKVEIKIDDNTACCVVPQIDFFGNIINLSGIAEKVQNKKALFIAVCDPISLGLIKPPGEYNVDIAVGEGQSLGNELGYGGPYLGLMSSKEHLLRFMPGRIVGETIDKDGKPGYVLTFQTREQHIRREKATSNICSNEALVALRTAVFLSTVGRKGLREMAKQSLIKTNYMKNRFIDAGFKVLNINNIFKEFVVEFDIDVKKISEKLFKNKIFGGIDLGMFYPSMKNYLLVAVTEMRTKEEIDKYIEILKSI